jgi:hypothetical protein
MVYMVRGLARNVGYSMKRNYEMANLRIQHGAASMPVVKHLLFVCYRIARQEFLEQKQQSKYRALHNGWINMLKIQKWQQWTSGRR